MARPIANKLDSQIVLPSQAFVPIKDSFSANQKEAKRKELDILKHQQYKMQDKLKELEAANQQLLSEMNDLKKIKENPILDGQTEHALRNATDMTLYLTKKLQNMHEAITKMEVRLHQHEKTLQEERGGMAALADKVVEIEANSVMNCQAKFARNESDMSSLRDSLLDLRKKLSDEQMERKTTEQKIIDRLNKQKEDLVSRNQPNVLPSAMPLQLNTKLEDRISHLENEIAKRQNNSDVIHSKDHINEIEKIKEDIEKMKKQLESDSKKLDTKKWADIKKEQEEELTNLYQSLKIERLRMNQELKAVKDSVSVVADKQVNQHKSMQDKLQAEILTRQQSECDTLRQMAVLDDKLMKIGSSFSLLNMRGNNSDKSEIVIKEMDSLKRLIADTEKNLEQKIENSISKLKPSLSSGHADFVRRQELVDFEKNISMKMERRSELPDTNFKTIESFHTWKDSAEKQFKDMRNDLDTQKESMDDYKVFKDISINNMDDLRGRIKLLSGQKTMTQFPANKEQEIKTDDEYRMNKEWKEQVDTSLEDLQTNIKVYREEILHNESKMNTLKHKLEGEISDRISAIEEVKELIDKGRSVEIKTNSAKEGLKKLANALQGTKSVLALKMQHEIKERENAIGYLTKRLEDLDSTVDGVEERLYKLEKEDKQDKKNFDPGHNQEKSKSAKKDEEFRAKETK